MKTLIMMSIIIVFAGCASLSEVRDRDRIISELNEKIAKDSIIIDSLSNYLDDETNRYKSASDSRDRWFADYAKCKRDLDTLSFKYFINEEKIKECYE